MDEVLPKESEEFKEIDRRRAKSFDSSIDYDIGRLSCPLRFEEFLKTHINLLEQWTYLLNLRKNKKSKLDIEVEDGKPTGGSYNEILSLSEYIIDLYEEVNQVTSSRREKNPQILDHIRNLDSLFDNVPKTESDFYVYRCYSNGKLPDYEVDDTDSTAEKTYVYKSFLSTAVSKNFLSRRRVFCRPPEYFMICIHIPIGSRVLPIVNHSDLLDHTEEPYTEYEILLDRFGKLKETGEMHNGVQLFELINLDDEKREELKADFFRGGRSHRKRKTNTKKKNKKKKNLKSKKRFYTFNV
jgi:hypothetical protein